MKKTVLVAGLIFVSLCSIFAGTSGKSFRPDTLMNNHDLTYILFESPSGLSDGKKLRLDIPTVGLRANYIASVLQNEKIWNVVDDLPDFDYAKLVDAGYSIIENYSGGQSGFGGADVSAAMQLGHFAIGLNAQADIACGSDEYDPQVTNVYLKPELNAALTVAYGGKLYSDDMLFVSGGVSVHAVYKVQTEKFDAAKAIGAVLAEDRVDFLMNDIKADAGFAISPDFNLNIKNESWKVAFDFTVKNAIGSCKMKCYDSISELIKFEDNSNSYVLETSPSVSLLVSSDLFTIDFFNKSIGLLLKAGISDFNFGMTDIKESLYAGIRFNVFDLVECSYEMKAGYSRFGACVGFGQNVLELMYGWHETGRHLGEKPVDSLIVKVQLGSWN